MTRRRLSTGALVAALAAGSVFAGGSAAAAAGPDHRAPAVHVTGKGKGKDARLTAYISHVQRQAAAQSARLDRFAADLRRRPGNITGPHRDLLLARTADDRAALAAVVTQVQAAGTYEQARQLAAALEVIGRFLPAKAALVDRLDRSGAAARAAVAQVAAARTLIEAEVAVGKDGTAALAAADALLAPATAVLAALDAQVQAVVAATDADGRGFGRLAQQAERTAAAARERSRGLPVLAVALAAAVTALQAVPEPEPGG
jgi:hypothetical protein